MVAPLGAHFGRQVGFDELPFVGACLVGGLDYAAVPQVLQHLPMLGGAMTGISTRGSTQAVHNRIHRCVCGGWIFEGQECRVCAILAAR